MGSKDAVLTVIKRTALVSLIDVFSGQAEDVGTLGDLQSWSADLVYDPKTRVVYATGIDASNGNHLYSLSLDSKTSGSAPITNLYALGGKSDGVIGTRAARRMRWGCPEILAAMRSSTRLSSAPA